MTTLILARHGETDWNRDGIWQGHGDPPLNDLGRRQATELAGRLADVSIDALYSSDLKRAYETAEIVARAKGLGITADPDLREMDVGSWSGLTSEEIATRFPGMAGHDGESREAFDERAVGALHRIAKAHEGRTWWSSRTVASSARSNVTSSASRETCSRTARSVEFRYEGETFARID